MPFKAPLSWLKDFVDPGMQPEVLAERLTTAGLEVEVIEEIGKNWGEYCVVGQISKIRKHPNADTLNLVDVEFGADELITIVTGAPNINVFRDNFPKKAPKVALALSGAMLVDAYDENHSIKKLKPIKIRGIKSVGMLCSELELGLSEDHDGIMILPEDAPIGELLQDYLGDSILNFDIKGGFSHLLSIHGIAREISALTGNKLNKKLLPKITNLEVVENPPFVKMEISDPDICSRYSALLIRNIKIGPSPFWMQQRLLRIGMRPINNIVDITNYVMFELGQPLHAFDYDKLIERANGKIPKITVRRAKKNESLQTLDGLDRKLDSEMLMIADNYGIIAIAGVMGGDDSEVSTSTSNVLLESANFEFLNNRRTSQVLKLKTEASERFGKQIDPGGTLHAALRAAELIASYGSGTIEPIAGDLYPKPKELITIELDPNYVEHLLGIKIPSEKITKILESLEFKVTGKNILKIEVPSHRMDIRIPADLVEEIVRIYGYENLPSTLLKEELPPQKINQKLEATELIRDILVGCGMDEIITYSMVNPLQEVNLCMEKELDLTKFVPIKNPLSSERSHLRRSLIPGALITCKSNLRYLEKVTIFEVGSVFHPRKMQNLPDEPRRLSLLLSGARESKSWLEKSENIYDFFDLKGVLESFLSALHIDGIQWQKSSDWPCHPGKGAKILVNERILGFAGELHPEIRELFELPELPICVSELNLDILIELFAKNHQMEFISNYTPIFEDLAFVLDANLPVEIITPAIKQTGGPLLRKVTLFDVYEGDQLEKGKRSLAYSLTFQARDRTLKDDEVAKIRDKILKRLRYEFQATLRI